MALRELLAQFDVKITGGNDLSKTIEKLGVGEAKSRLLAQSFSALKAALPLAALGYGVKLLGDWAYGATQAADREGELAEQLGFSARSLQQWGQFASFAGGRAADFEKITATLGDTVSAAVAGAGPQRKMLEDLGIAYTDASGNARDMEEVLLDAAVAIGSVQNPTEKLTLANDLLGKGGRKLATNFKGTREEMLATIETAGELGGIYSDDFVKASAEANDELEATERQYATLRSEIVMLVLPALRWLVQGFGAVASGVRSFLRETKVLDRWFKLLPAILAGIGLKLLISNFAAVGAWLLRIGKLLLPFAKLILPFIVWALILDDLIVFLEGGDSALGALLDTLFGVGTATDLVWMLSTAWGAVGAGVTQLIEDVAALWERIGGFTGIFAALKTAGAAVFQAIADFILAGPVERMQMLFAVMQSVWEFVKKIGGGIASLATSTPSWVKSLGDLKMDQEDAKAGRGAQFLVGGKAQAYDKSTIRREIVNAPTTVTVNLQGKQSPETVRTATGEAGRLAGQGRAGANALVRGAT